MKESNEHLNIDLDFLDKKEPVRVAKKSEPAGKSSAPNGVEWNRKNILILGVIVLFLGLAMFSDGGDSSSSSTYTSTPNASSNKFINQGGQTFRCSDSDYNRAMQLRPSLSLGSQLTTESDALDVRVAANNAEKNDIERSYVNEDNEYEVDAYNERVDDYNIERQRLLNAVTSLQQRHATLNNQIDTYNNFLDVNCRPE